MGPLERIYAEPELGSGAGLPKPTLTRANDISTYYSSQLDEQNPLSSIRSIFNRMPHWIPAFCYPEVGSPSPEFPSSWIHQRSSSPKELSAHLPSLAQASPDIPVIFKLMQSQLSKETHYSLSARRESSAPSSSSHRAQLMKNFLFLD
ncbi:hypothetical protein SAY86_011500 [Trapa natans]|uniref:Uncharacterized protein n=1 Tax=Trapa natans TaxID=22666 RepID=A0AAN7R2V5_TRANT|nr:hypothetical protein SAY86_011500 [Trapa natans]